MKSIICIAHNLRSIHNVGSLLRTCEGLGINEVILTGYTPHPTILNDSRLPHESMKITKQIHKTALGAEESMKWQYVESISLVITKLKNDGFTIAALEQAENSISLPEFQPPSKIALVLGREVEGLEPDIMKLCEYAVEIPMFGSKESFNVVQAAAMALYHCRFA